ncbi:MAG TPA: phosphatidylserine/phosphatidylglycerophosphate/cardiolipin synthase family protein [Ktedonobacterales bacterium]|nr:phosphatidylserine/phosphatidylglycerophosphate/cardiolipin synthase family protein [Ktedonobacterales bacterium]
MNLQPQAGDDMAIGFLAESEQRATDVASALVDFLQQARHSLDFAVYDLRLSDALKAMLAAALAERARAGVAIRIAYDADKPALPALAIGMDPAPGGTGDFVRSLSYPYRRIGGMKLMHNKYIVRDAGTASAAVWTGSTNFTDDAWTLMENNIVVLASAQVAAAYTHDFTDLWQSGTIENTGQFDPDPVQLIFGGEPVRAQVLFSPGEGPAIDHEVARMVGGARRRVRICSMLLNSGALLGALRDLLRAGDVPVDGIYDQTQMREVLQQWQEVPPNRWKIGAIEEIVSAAGLVGKRSTPYSPTGRHDFMHNKVLVVDDTVMTGSYNFSHSAEQNAENILLLESAPLAEAYSRYIDHLKAKYG